MCKEKLGTLPHTSLQSSHCKKYFDVGCIDQIILYMYKYIDLVLTKIG